MGLIFHILRTNYLAGDVPQITQKLFVNPWILVLGLQMHPLRDKNKKDRCLNLRTQLINNINMKNLSILNEERKEMIGLLFFYF